VIRKLSQSLVIFIVVTRLRINHSLQQYSPYIEQEIEFEYTMATATDPITIDEINNDHYYNNEILDLEVNAPTYLGSSKTRLREPLRFDFKGYSIWLEVDEIENDLTDTIHRVSNELGVVPIPSAHITVVYGIDHLTDDEIFKRFDRLQEKIKSWPTLRPRGVITDIELAGVQGGLMDMAWTEISFATSPDHESLVSSVHQIFDMPRNTTDSWLPHISLAYDNPENTSLNLMYTANIIAQKPTLFHERNVKAISLWNTQGKLQDWKLVSRFDCK